jgi:hypothetical protein
MNCDQSKETGVEVPPSPVTPKISRDRRGGDDPPNQHNRKIMSILPLHDSIFAQVADVGWPRLNSRFYEHPHNMGLYSKIDSYE